MNRIKFASIVYYNYNKEPPNSIAIIKAPTSCESRSLEPQEHFSQPESQDHVDPRELIAFICLRDKSNIRRSKRETGLSWQPLGTAVLHL